MLIFTLAIAQQPRPVRQQEMSEEEAELAELQSSMAM
jgi:hypothetical protein